jgi:ABC-2 type transport system ATP-binding protein
MLRIRNFKKSYQSHLVLSIDELDVPPGITWLKGENGSGKTSLFKSLAGILPFDGDVTWDNISLKKDPIAFRRIVNYSEAEPSYPEFLTAKDLVRFVGKAKGSSEQEQDHYCSQLGVNGYFSKPCGTFSSGMLKKMSLAIAFLGNPKVIILDEPLVTLDEASRGILMELIMHKLADPRVTFLMSSHQTMDTSLLPVRNIYVIQNKSIELL